MHQDVSFQVQNFMRVSAKFHGPLNNSGEYAIFILNTLEIRYIGHCDAVVIVKTQKFIIVRNVASRTPNYSL